MSDQNQTYLKWAIVVVLAVAAVVAVLTGVNTTPEAVATSSAVQVPEAINTAIRIGIIALLTAGFTWLFKIFGVDLRGMVPALSLAISTWIVAELQNIINTIPASFDPIVSTVLYFLVLILAPVGGLWLLNRKEENPTRLL